MLLLIHFFEDEVRSKVTEKEKQIDKEKKQMEKKDMEKKEMEMKEMEKNEKEKDKDTLVIRQQSKLLTVIEIFMFYVMY